MRTCQLCQKMAPDEAAFCPNCGAQFPVASARGGMSAKTALILVAAISVPLFVMCAGILAAIAVPNLLDSIERSRQKRAMSDVRSLALAVQTFLTDQNTLPAAPGMAQGGGWHEVTAQQLASVLVPNYTPSIPAADPWGEPYLYGLDAEAQQFYLLSLGKNRARELEGIPDTPRNTGCYESDILWLGEEFWQYPDGKQRMCGDAVISREQTGTGG